MFRACSRQPPVISDRVLDKKRWLLLYETLKSDYIFENPSNNRRFDPLVRTPVIINSLIIIGYCQMLRMFFNKFSPTWIKLHSRYNLPYMGNLVAACFQGYPFWKHFLPREVIFPSLLQFAPCFWQSSRARESDYWLGIAAWCTASALMKIDTSVIDRPGFSWQSRNRLHKWTYFFWAELADMHDFNWTHRANWFVLFILKPLRDAFLSRMRFGHESFL